MLRRILLEVYRYLHSTPIGCQSLVRLNSDCMAPAFSVITERIELHAEQCYIVNSIIAWYNTRLMFELHVEILRATELVNRWSLDNGLFLPQV